MRPLVARAIDLLYPRVCANCERVGGSWCVQCLAALQAEPVLTIEREIAALPVLATGDHTGILRNAIHAFKFESEQRLAAALADRLGQVLARLPFPDTVIVPVPLHHQREAWRGYNQSALLAACLSTVLAVPYLNALTRTRSTGTQVGRDADERRRAVQGAFLADSAIVQHRHALLLDDVVTTGSTLLACADALRAAGALSVTAACVVSA